MDWILDLFSFFSRNTTWDILSPGTVCLEKTVLGKEVGGLGGASVVKASSEIHPSSHGRSSCNHRLPAHWGGLSPPRCSSGRILFNETNAGMYITNSTPTKTSVIGRSAYSLPS